MEPLFRGKGIATQLQQDMPAGDFCFEGNGPDRRFLIGVERKAIRDMITSIRSGRFSGHQLPALLDMYDRSYVIVEGIWGPGDDGVMMEPRRNNGKTSWVPLVVGNQTFMYSMVDKFIISVEETCGIRFHRTSSKEETVHHVVNLYKEWNDKPYNKRSAHVSQVEGAHVEFLRPWSIARKVANQLPGIGTENSLSVERHFGSVVEMAKAEEAEWADIDVPSGQGTRKLGKAKAEKIWKGLRGQ